MITFDCNNMAQAEAYLKQNCNNGRCYVVSVVFGLAYAKAYKNPSSIPYSIIGDAYQFGGKYWRDGGWHEFQPHKVVKYQNANLGCE